jgi:uncharacterized protein YjeT (DUF2065 family)
MTPQTVNLLLYLLFWSVFALGTVITFNLAATLISVLDEQFPGGCPAQLRRLTWMLTTVWSASMFMEGINFSRPYITAAFW